MKPRHKQAPQKLPRRQLDFRHFSDQEWNAISKLLPQVLPEYCDLHGMRTLTEDALFSFCAMRNLPRGTHALLIHDNGFVSDFDLAGAHRRIANAARTFVDVYDPALNVDANRQPVDDPRDHVSWLEKIAADHDRAAAEAEKDLYPANPTSLRTRRGRKRDEALERLTDNLIWGWDWAGGAVGGGSHKPDGGPLIRFLKAATRPVLSTEPTTEIVRHWIRGFKRRHLGKKPWRRRRYWHHVIDELGKNLLTKYPIPPRGKNSARNF